MKYVKNIFLVLTFALSAAAFSTSAMAASDTKAPPEANDIPHEPLPGMSKFCQDLLDGGGMGLMPPGMYQYCWEH
ncbi:hypothetical protein BHM08_21525 [Salmonella enterica]|nr:hypothetical protein [Salmonella enterica]EBQ4291959.1 hypothetical protein [Salmonella enterica]EBQ4485917.1 hypothetical protein [Salmonella enterica]EBQ4503437.1 hypothetical protein [Salmonella enterica]ECC2509509.1 hypothetical protein [Salmonella enterica]